MKMTKHTEGDWQFEYDNAGNGGYSAWFQIVTDDAVIGRIYGESLEARANARLVCAAPLLLAALKAVQTIRSDWFEYCPWCRRKYGGHTEDCQSQLAIAAAEEET